MKRYPLPRRHGDDRGMAGGADILFFGLIMMAFTSLLIVNVWTVIDASLAVSASAREGARTYVESDPATAQANAIAAMEQAMQEYGRDTRATAPTFSGSDYERCAVVTVTAGYDVAFISIPIFGDFGSLTTIEATHSERIDPYRSGEFAGACA